MPRFGLGGIFGTLGQYLGSGFLPKKAQVPFMAKFQERWNLLDGTSLYGTKDPGGQIVRPTADQIGQARLDSMGLTTAHSDYLASMSTSGGGSSASGGGGGGGAAAAAPVAVSVYAYVDWNELKREYRRDPESQKHIISVVRSAV
jgi:hypothetical protein